MVHFKKSVEMEGLCSKENNSPDFKTEANQIRGCQMVPFA